MTLSSVVTPEKRKEADREREKERERERVRSVWALRFVSGRGLAGDGIRTSTY